MFCPGLFRNQAPARTNCVLAKVTNGNVLKKLVIRYLKSLEI